MTSPEVSAAASRGTFEFMLALLNEDAATVVAVRHSPENFANLMAAAFLIVRELPPRKRAKLREIATRRLRKLEEAT